MNKGGLKKSTPRFLTAFLYIRMDDPVNTPEFWEACYESEMDGWDLGGPTPVFQRLASELPKGRICVIGCGRGYDAVTFAKSGFDVTVIDLLITHSATKLNAEKLT